MRLFSTISDGIRWILGRYGIRYNIAQSLATVVNTSPPFSPEGITNELYAPHDMVE